MHSGTVLPPFEAAEFLKRVKKERGNVSHEGDQSKGAAQGLYARFIKGPNFQPWFNSQRDLAISRMGAHTARSSCPSEASRLCSSSATLRCLWQKTFDRARSGTRTRCLAGVLDKGLHDAIQDHLNTLDALLPPPRLRTIATDQT